MDGFGCVVLSVVRRTHIWLKGVSGGDVFRFTLVKQAHASARKRKRKDVHTETFVKQTQTQGKETFSFFLRLHLRLLMSCFTNFSV